jgi:hypothetical protein
MRRVTVAAAFALVVLASAIASAKIPYFGLDVRPQRPEVGEPITLTMTCYENADHTRPWSSCLGAGGVMAWVHPLDREGALGLDDWIPVQGHATAGGATRGRITIDEAGAYDVLPIWRRWRYEHSRGFPDPIRIEVEGLGPVFPIVVAWVGVMATGIVVSKRRRAVVNR